jgi:hypothetical protein
MLLTVKTSGFGFKTNEKQQLHVYRNNCGSHRLSACWQKQFAIPFEYTVRKRLMMEAGKSNEEK